MNAHRHRSARVYCGSLIAIAALAGVGLWVLAALGGPPANDAPPAKDAPTLSGMVVPLQDDALEIGPIEGLTTAWHQAPEGTSIPVGLNLLFRTKATPTDTVTWTGAIEISRNDTWSTAICFLASPGDELVRAVVSSAQESYADEIRFNVVNIPLELITVSPISVGPDPMEIDESLPPEELNQITMAYYFGKSIAAISPVGEGLYRTSINRLIPLQVTVMPQGFGPLIEWRVDGYAAKLGVSVEQALDEIGLHTISAGPPAGEQTIDVETYEVIITSHVSGEDIIPEGEPVVFTAVTDPPGYEDDITWLSSTLYGTGYPLLGEGPVFIAEFNDTWGPHPDGGQWQWLGAKADNVAFGQDQKLCLNPCECYPGLDRDNCGLLSACILGGCTNRRVNGKLKDGRCKFLGILGQDISNTAQAMDLWLQAYEVSGAGGGGPPDPVLVASAQSVPLSSEQHELVRQIAISTQGMYLGWTSYLNDEEHLVGFFTPPALTRSEICDNPYEPGDHGIVEPLDACRLAVGQLIRQAMVGELQNPGQGIFDTFMGEIPVACPEYVTYQACEFPHPPSHGHPFPYADGLSCLSFVLMQPLVSIMAGPLLTGACCDPDYVCIENTQADCAQVGGVYQGDGTSCGFQGACTLPNSVCLITSETCCALAGGSFAGEGTICD